MSYDPVQGIYDSGMQAEQGLQAVNDQIAQLTAKITLISGMMATLNPMIACQLAVYEMGLIGQQQSLVQVAKPAQELDVQNALLNGVTLQQSLYNQLCIGSEGYYNSTVYGTTGTGGTATGNTSTTDGIYTGPEKNTGPAYTDSNGKTVQTGDYVDADGNLATASTAATVTVPCDTVQQQADYQNTMAEFDECTATLNTVLAASLDKDSPYYNWLDPNTANSLYANEQSIDGILASDPDNLADQCTSFSYQYMCYTANPSQPTNPQGDPINNDKANGPTVAADPYPVASNVQILTQSFNTNISMVNSCTQTTTGEIKSGTAEVQQMYGALKSMADDINQGKTTNINNLRAGA